MSKIEKELEQQAKCILELQDRQIGLIERIANLEEETSRVWDALEAAQERLDTQCTIRS